jgi:AcrR family transcriptional regulator
MSRRRTDLDKPRGDTALGLMRAAERLFATNGVDVVSLREVSAAAGQANNSAVGYHFGSREGLIDGILERHSLPIQVRYAAQLDLLQRQGGYTLRALLETLVLPLVDKLDDVDGGPEFIAISAQLSVSPTMPLAQRPIATTPAVMRLIEAMMPFSQTPPSLLLFRFERVANTIYAALTVWQRLATVDAAPVSRDAFVSDLLDTLESLVSQPASPATLALVVN